ncbi:MAG: hypothetical protein IIA23_08075 [Chloroflexi bacterium]|nr:hypothetical protein [Chloroflexota bacterium]
MSKEKARAIKNPDWGYGGGVTDEPKRVWVGGLPKNEKLGGDGIDVMKAKGIIDDDFVKRNEIKR